MISSAVAVTAVPWVGGVAGGVVAAFFVVRQIVKFQQDFTDRYSREVKDQAAQITRLNASLSQLRSEHAAEMTAELAHRQQCEHDLAKQGRLLESVMVRLEQLDRRKTPPRPDVDR